MASEERLKALDNFFSSIINTIPRQFYEHLASEDTITNDNSAMIGSKYYKVSLSILPNGRLFELITFVKHKKAPLTANERKMISKSKKADVYGVQSAAVVIYMF
jgi:hypothetical protein